METINQDSKKARGGSRKGAGRKPCTIKAIVKKMSKDSAHLILAEIKANSKWKTLAESPDERIQLEVLKYLTDRAFGKAKQSVEATGKDGEPLTISVRYL